MLIKWTLLEMMIIALEQTRKKKKGQNRIGQDKRQNQTTDRLEQTHYYWFSLFSC